MTIGQTSSAASNASPGPLPLESAIDAGDIERVRAALQSGADPNHPSASLTPLMLAAARGQTRAVRLLLEHGARVNVLDDVIGTSALHLAAQGGNVEIIRLLLGHGAHVNMQAPSHGFTALMNAVWHRQADAVQYLLSRDDTNVEITNALGLKARDLFDLFMTGPSIRVAVREQHAREAERFHAMFEHYTQRRARKVADQRLMSAIVNRDKRLTDEQQLATVHAEIAAGANVNAVSAVMSSGYDAHTPLLAASLFGQARIVEALLLAGADPTIGCGYMKANPAHKAASFGHTDVMRALAAHPSFTKIRDARGPYNGYTPLMDAIWHGHLDAARVLLKAGADIHLRGHDGKTALDLAREFGYPDIEAALKETDAEQGDPAAQSKSS